MVRDDGLTVGGRRGWMGLGLVVGVLAAGAVYAQAAAQAAPAQQAQAAPTSARVRVRRRAWC